MLKTVTQPTDASTVSARVLTAAPPINGSAKKPILYPERDGNPMSDNTKQFHYIVSIKTGFDGLYKDDPNVFVAGDLLWYPVEGDNRTRTAPDVMLAFGRPKGHRGSYMQWVEGGVAPQVAFEILSPGNRLTEMARKRLFYERFGVEEYYEYDPDRGDLVGWVRQNGHLELIEEMNGWVSPRTGVRFELTAEGELVLYRPNGQRFESYIELLERAEQEAARANQEAARAEQAQLIAEQERTRAERLAARLRELGLDPK
jgi:Uma2 family endonuclease